MEVLIGDEKAHQAYKVIDVVSPVLRSCTHTPVDKNSRATVIHKDVGRAHIIVGDSETMRKQLGGTSRAFSHNSSLKHSSLLGFQELRWTEEGSRTCGKWLPLSPSM
mmetsp:Transcript_26863/g.38354  ORF Transcript_26863/g.38354 Transcript_26863/m.38354 type:complete len:107 (+) Transcript_26863:262-582(+)